MWIVDEQGGLVGTRGATVCKSIHLGLLLPMLLVGDELHPRTVGKLCIDNG